MSEWKECLLGDVCDLVAGFAFKSADFGDYESKVIKITHITPPRVDETSLAGVDISKYDCAKLEKYIVRSGDYVFAMTGATIGKIGRLYNGIAYINQRVLTFRNKSNLVDKDFLYYVLQKDDFAKYVYNHIDSESAQPNISANTVAKYEFLLPPLAEQQRIAGILSSLDDKIELNNKINDNLEKQAQALFKNWFIDYAPFGGQMPSDWKEGKLSDIATIKKNSFHPERNPGLTVEHYSLPALDEKHFPVFEVADGIKSNKFIVSKESVLISKLNPDTKRIWRPYCISDYPICSTEFVVFESINGSHRDYLYSIIDCTQFYDFMGSLVTGCTNSHQRVSPETLLTYPVAIPSKETLKSFCAKVTPLYEMIEKNVLETQRLTTLRDTLLPKLMSGEMDVENIQI